MSAALRVLHRLRHLTVVVVCLALLTACTVSLNTDPEPDVRVIDEGQISIERIPATVVEQADGTVVMQAASTPTRPPASGTLRLAGPAYLPTTLDPALLGDADSAFLARQVWRGLVRLNDDLEPQPELAERIEIAADQQTYVFDLRPGLTFQDDTPLTADSVAASFARACNPEALNVSSDAIGCGIYLGDIVGVDAMLAGEATSLSGVEVLSDTALQITLRRPAVAFLHKLAGSPALIVDVRETRDADWWQEPNGSGPFALSQWSSTRITLDQVDTYVPGPAAVEQVHLSTGSAALNALNAFEAGDLDVVDLPTYAVDRARSEGDPLHTGLIETPQLTTTFVLINPNIPPWDDIRLREAVFTGFERERVATTLLDGSVQVATSLVPPGILGVEWAVDLPTYDPVSARALADALPAYAIPPALYDSGIAATLAEAVSETLAITVQAVSVEWPTYVGMMDERVLPAFVLTWIADYADPENFLTSMLHSASPDNVIAYANPELDALLDAAAVESDIGERVRLFTAAEQLAVDDYVLLPLYVDVAYTVAQPWVLGWNVSPVGVLMLDDVQVGGS